MSHGIHPVLERTNLAGRPVAAADREQFLRTYGPLFDHSPWVVERAWAMRPFADAKALHGAFLRVIASASPEERLALARAQPEPQDEAAPADGESLEALGRAYREKHGFPFVICARLNSRASILAALKARTDQDSQSELDEAMTQVGLISRLRLAEVKP